MAEQKSTFLAPERLGLYFHIPFCVRKCLYCDFFSVAGHHAWFDRYLQAVQRQIVEEAATAWCRQRRVETVFFGGGTPTVLAPEQLVFLLRESRRHFCFDSESVEATIEVNPATVDLDGLCTLRRGGFNRISIGVQSLDDGELVALGRPHTAHDALQAVTMARQAGFANLSLDLMYGLPDQKLASWQKTLDMALALAPDHLSIYELTLEPATPFHDQAVKGTLNLPDEETVLTMMEHTRTTVRQAGLVRYEISNFSRPGYACRHNLNYWRNGSYIGLGAGAVSCRSGCRTTSVADVRQYCLWIEGGKSVLSEEEFLGPEARFRETVIMGLRMINGLCLSELEKRFEINPLNYYGSTVEALLDQGLLEIQEDHLRLTGKGLPVANSVMAELV